MPLPSTLVFVHGWSVRNTDTYGGLPERLTRAAAEAGFTLDVKNVWLGKYVSFRDEVRVADLARAFQAALRRDLGPLLESGGRFACITHSTGAPVVREWWHRFYLDRKDAPPCPMSHLVMLAPANFGSSLAQLGKSRLSRIKALFQGVEPGAGVLDWLELGSPESWDLNRRWIFQPKKVIETSGVFPFVLTGQKIDRKLYDHLNPYTGEAGSDGVVRVAAANLNATYVRLKPDDPIPSAAKKVSTLAMEAKLSVAPVTAFKVVPGRSHSGEDFGILRSVNRDSEGHPTIEAVLRCLQVETPAAYDGLAADFARENEKTQDDERVEVARWIVLRDTVYVTDRYSMVIFRVQDDQGGLIGDFDLKLLAAPAGEPGKPARNPSPDLLPQGFFGDRQRNRRHPGTLTYFLNADAMHGFQELTVKGEVHRKPTEGAETLGFLIEPFLDAGLAHYAGAQLEAQSRILDGVVKPNQTTLVDIVLPRIVREGAFRPGRLDRRKDVDFDQDPPGNPIPLD